MNPMNKQSLKERLAHYKNSPVSLILLILVLICAALTVITLIFIVIYILIRGIPHLSLSLFSPTYNSDNVSMLPAIINTFIMTLISLIIAVPLGIYSILSGALTLAIMILPLIMRTTEEALKSVPDSYREGSFGLGAGKLRTVFRIVLPPAIPGILSGIILATGRICGETAALIFTAGTGTKIALNLMSSGRTLAVHMYNLSSEGLHIDECYATAVVLLALVAVINSISGLLAKKLSKG